MSAQGWITRSTYTLFALPGFVTSALAGAEVPVAFGFSGPCALRLLVGFLFGLVGFVVLGFLASWLVDFLALWLFLVVGIF